MFLEKALELCCKKGMIGFIIPYSYAIQKYATLSRAEILLSTGISRIADLRTIRVFNEVPVITIIPILQKQKPDPGHVTIIDGPSKEATKHHPGSLQPSRELVQARLATLPEKMLRIDFTEEVAAIIKKIDDLSIALGDLTLVNYGAQMSSRQKGGFGKEYVLRDKKNTSTCRKTISGRNLYRYRPNWRGAYVEWALAPKMYGPRAAWFFELPKLMIRDITGTHRIEAALDGSGLYCDHTILCALRICDVPDGERTDTEEALLSQLYSLAFLQAIVASQLVSAYYYWTLTGEGVRTGGGFHTYPTTIWALPVPAPAVLKRAANQDLIEEIGKLSDRLADTQRQQQVETSPARRDQLAQRFEADDARLDSLIYRIYGLGKDEIKLVEAATITV